MISLILYALILFIVEPMDAERKKLEEQKTLLDQEIQTFSVSLSASAGKDERVRGRSSFFLDPTLWRDIAFPALVDEMSDMARTQGIEVLEISQGVVETRGEDIEEGVVVQEKKGRHQILPIHFKLRSKFIHLGEFVYALEHMPLPIVVEGLKIDASDASLSGVVMQLSIHLYKKDKKGEA